MTRHASLIRPLALLLGLAALAACAPDGPATPAADAAVLGPDAAPDPDVDAAAPEPADPALVVTETGPVRGRVDDDLRVFRGIPYAAPPLGDLRFQPPRPHPGWQEVRAAAASGPACPQSGLLTQQPLPWSEDCLTLDIWTHGDDQPRPVMVFVHGGGFVDGSGSLLLYDGSSLARAGDVVVVTLNYRLGPFGFLATDALAQSNAAVGNTGILDQVAALGWVQRNIAAFGGDPERVLLFGESAGAASVCVHLASPLSKGLFQRAILQSGNGCTGFVAPDAPAPSTGRSAFDFGARLVAHTECAAAEDQAACLRALPAQALLDAVAAEVQAAGPMALLGFQPLLDGVVLDRDPLTAFADGSAHDVPILIGANSDEWSLFAVGGFEPAPASEDEYVARIEARFGGLAPALLALYPAADFATPAHAYESLISDVTFICPAERFAEAASGGPAPAFAYLFTHAMGGPLGERLGAAHMFELGFVFDSIAALPFAQGLTVTETETRLVARIQQAWARFARDGAPALEPAWPATTAAAPRIAILDEPSEIAAEIRDGRCAELRTLGLVR
jgi:para-nitrobenzyl esterase